MDFLVKDGDYVLSGKGNVVIVSGLEQDAQLAGIKISAEKGAFFADLNFGSDIHKLLGSKSKDVGSLAYEYASKALAGGHMYIDSVDASRAGSRAVINLKLRYDEGITVAGEDAEDIKNRLINIEVNL